MDTHDTSSNELWDYLNALDDELLKGGAVLPEWCSLIVRESDKAFAGEAYLACILTAVAGIETFLRSEIQGGARLTLAKLIDAVVLDPEHQADIHSLRIYRNKWVHVSDPWEDADLLDGLQQMEAELKEMAFFASRQWRRTIYSNPWI